MKNKCFKDYLEIFEMEINSKEYVYTQDKTEKVRIADFTWKPCYKKEHYIRKIFPKYWFISNKGHVISVYKGKAYLLKKDLDNGRYSYHFRIYDDDGRYVIKNIELHNLLLLVHDGYFFGKAKEILKERGLYAFGVREKNKVNLQGHHIKGKDNDINNTEGLTTNVHETIQKAPNELTDDVVGDFVQELGTVVADEEPNEICILETGQIVNKNTLEIIEDDTSRSIYATDDIKMSNNAIKQIQRYNTINIATDLLINNYGNDYFIEPKYLYTKDDLLHFYKCEMAADELKIKEINDTRELANKNYIMCYINADNKVECYIENKEQGEEKYV